MNVWGNIIRDLMKEQRVSQRALAETSGVNRTALRALLAGGTCEIGKVQKMLAVLGYKLDIIPIEDFEPHKPNPRVARYARRNRDKYRGIKPNPAWLGEQVEDA